MNLGAPFPPDLPDLLRLACRQGQMRLHVWFGMKDGARAHQANLANTGQGWTVDSDQDSLEAIAKVLRARFGSMLERERAAARAATSDPRQIDLEEAIAATAADDDLADLIG